MSCSGNKYLFEENCEDQCPEQMFGKFLKILIEFIKILKNLIEVFSFKFCKMKPDLLLLVILLIFLEFLIIMRIY